MSHSSQRPRSAAVSRLVNLWAARYRPDFSLLAASASSILLGEIEQSLLVSGRQELSAKLNPRVVIQACKQAAIRTQDLYAHFEELDLKEITNLAQLTSRVYLQLIELYQTYPLTLVAKPEELEHMSPDQLGRVFYIKNLRALAEHLEPFLTEFRLQGIISDSWKTLGFITTQVNLTNALLLEPLNAVEKALMSPYFNFLEEQIAMPWQRLCAAAEGAAAPVVTLVERMMPQVSAISMAAHTHWHQCFPYYYARRGGLEHPDVKHSSLRDFSMFQVYLWLSVLQGSSRIVETELVVLCRIVYGEIGIPWDMTVKGTKLLMEKVLDRVERDQLMLVSPYTSGMVRAFIKRDNSLLGLAAPQDLSKLVQMG